MSPKTSVRDPRTDWTHAPSPPSRPGLAEYDGLASIYRVLEGLAFGDVLQRARTAYLDTVPAGADVLSLGEGDGRFLSALLAVRPDVRVTALDASAAMLDQTRRRASAHAIGRSVRTVHADVRDHRPPAGSFDVVAAMFLLDQFTCRERSAFLPSYVRSLRPGGLWLHADFAIPDAGWRRVRARMWLDVLYRFFGATTGMSVSTLEPITPSLRIAGLTPMARRTWSHGFVEAIAFRAGEGPETRAL